MGYMSGNLPQAFFTAWGFMHMHQKVPEVRVNDKLREFQKEGRSSHTFQHKHKQTRRDVWCSGDLLEATKHLRALTTHSHADVMILQHRVIFTEKMLTAFNNLACSSMQQHVRDLVLVHADR